jgi:hypothetical protein
MRADADPGDSSITANNKRRTPCKVERVDTHALVHAVRARHRPRFIEKDREGIGMFQDVLLTLEESVNFLRCDECDFRIAFLEFLVSRLELSQLIRAVGSPGAADEHQHQRLSAIVGKPHRFAVGGGEGELRRRIADSKRL